MLVEYPENEGFKHRIELDNEKFPKTLKRNSIFTKLNKRNLIKIESRYIYKKLIYEKRI